MAVKFDPSTETSNLKETLFLKDMKKMTQEKGIKINIPTYYLHGSFNLRSFFVMTYLPDSIEDYIKS